MSRRLATLFLFSLLSNMAWAGVGNIEIQKGKISGKRDANGVDAFLGIPYAAPPVGELRWKAPRPVKPWNGILKAEKFSEACSQHGNFFANVPASEFDKPVGSEDCLYLNVWRTSKVTPEAKMPVVVWIHGGSNFKGTASDPMYDGSYLADKSKIVFVSLNYRLGMFGAIAYKPLEVGASLDQSGNFVTLDLVQGLKWVRDNIQSFGGDPDNVTIMGQSAGCMNVWGLLQTPLSEGLFHKAVCSSGLPNVYPRTVARARTNDYVENLVFNAGLVKDRKKAGEFLDSKSDKWKRDFMYSRTTAELIEGQDYAVPVQHIADDVVFPHGLEATALGFYQQVPMILGSTMDEGTYLVGGTMLKPDLQTLWGYMQTSPSNLKIEDLINTNYAAFRSATKAGSMALQRTISNVYLTAKLYNSETYLYSFEWNETPSPWKEVFGALHGIDAVFYLGNFDSKKDNFAKFAWTENNRASREALREKMNEHFTRFFWQGKTGWKGSIDFK